jgi:hypothetical protein
MNTSKHFLPVFQTKLGSKANFLFLIILSVILSGLLWPTYGQWMKHTLDDDIFYVYGVAVADLDGDDDLDVVAADFWLDNVYWYGQR